MKQETSEFILVITCDPARTNLIVNVICQLLQKFSRSLGSFNYSVVAKQPRSDD